VREGIQALEAVLGLNGIVMVNIGDKFVKAMAEAQGGAAGGRFDTNSPAQLPEMGQFVTHVVQLKIRQAERLERRVGPLCEDSGQHPGDGCQPNTGAAGLHRERQAHVGADQSDRRSDPLGVCVGGHPDQVCEGSEIAGGLEQLKLRLQRRRHHGWRGGATGTRSTRTTSGMNRTGGSLGVIRAKPRRDGDAARRGWHPHWAGRQFFRPAAPGIINRVNATVRFRCWVRPRSYSDERTNSLLIYASRTT